MPELPDQNNSFSSEWHVYEPTRTLSDNQTHCSNAEPRIWLGRNIDKTSHFSDREVKPISWLHY